MNQFTVKVSLCILCPELKELEQNHNNKKIVIYELHAFISCPKVFGTFFSKKKKIIHKNKFSWPSQGLFLCIQHLQTAYTSVLTCSSLETRSSRLNWNVAIVSLHVWVMHLRLCKVTSQRYSNHTLTFYSNVICWRIKIYKSKRQMQIAF